MREYYQTAKPPRHASPFENAEQNCTDGAMQRPVRLPDHRQESFELLE